MMWTDEKNDMLRSMWADGFSGSQIAAELGAPLTRSAVIGKAHRLGLPARIERQQSQIKQKPNESTAVPVYCHSCQKQIDLPGTYRIVEGYSYHLGCTLPFYPRPITVASPNINGGPITLIELTNRTCRWPVNDDVRHMLYCGKPQADLDGRRPYCNHHTKIAWRGT